MRLLTATWLPKESEMRLRIAWGGGEARQWRGSISVDNGALSQSTPLGILPDEPGSLHLEDGRLQIVQRGSRTYGAVDLTVTAPPDARLKISLTASDAPDSPRNFDFALSELVGESKGGELDSSGNRLGVRRAPGDRLRVRFDRAHLVFSPRERFQVSVEPHLFTTTGSSIVNLELRLLKARSEVEVWRDQRQMRAASDGSLAEIGPLSIDLPQEEGVYDLVVSLVPWHLPAPFVRAKPLLERKIQLVSVDPRPLQSETTPWRELLQLDPANPSRWERWKHLPQLQLLPGFSREAIDNSVDAAAQSPGPRLYRASAFGLAGVSVAGQQHRSSAHRRSRVSQRPRANARHKDRRSQLGRQDCSHRPRFRGRCPAVAGAFPHAAGPAPAGLLAADHVADDFAGESA